MKNLHLLFLCFPVFLSAQLNINIENAYFYDFEDRACPYNDSVSLQLPVGWELYRTLDDKWDGVRDSTECFEATPGLFYGADFSVEGIMTNRPVFLRALLTNENKQLLAPNWIYSFNFHIVNSPLIDNDCSDGACSRFLIGTEIPNADSTGTALRMYESVFTNSGYYNICVGTEYFDTSYLREVIFELRINPNPDISDQKVTFGGVEAEPSWKPPSILQDTIIAPEWSFDGDSIYTFDLDQVIGTFGGGYLVVHDEDSYPQPGNTSYLEVAPAFPSATQQSINVMLYWGNLIFAPFTSIRGTMVEGSDSIRNVVNLFLPDEIECLPFIDVAFNTPVALFPGVGGINLLSNKSCFAFSHGAQLAIASGRNITYGENGVGILALGIDGRIVLQPNSTLTINNELRLPDHHGRPTDQTWVELPRGSRLTFGPLATINKIGAYAESGYMKLNVLMNGGELDDHLLSAKERSYINRIYPEDIGNAGQLLQIMPNPVNGQFDFSITIPNASAYSWQLLNTSGHRVKSGEGTAQKGISYHSISVGDIAAGVYFLQVQTKTKSMTGEVLVVE